VRNLIVNADDFGFTRDVNAGIVQAHREGILTATTLMANGDAYEDAVHLALENPSLHVGCHLVLVQGNSLVTGRPFPEKPHQLLMALSKREIEVETELRAQIRKIIESGIRPTHLDSHKHTHIVPTVFRAVVRLAHEFGIPYVRLPLDTTVPCSGPVCHVLGRYYRGFTHKFNVHTTDYFMGFRLTGNLTEATLARALASIKDGTTEFMCHPGYMGRELQGAATRLKESRVRELEALTSPRIRRLIDEQGITLTGYC
jgi:predicted glycoside hydrolase/deacetylase ChbG (UPF0249 family)